MTGLHFSRLGFGTSGLMGSALTTGGRLRLLLTAFDHGITHFDTAPLYGMGLAEEVLGRFVLGRRDAVTITTKFGLDPRPIPAPVRPFLPVARLIRRRLVRHMSPRRTVSLQMPSASVSSSSASLLPPPPPPVPYTQASIRAHLEESLRKLRCDHVDYFLLHDCHPAYVTEDVILILEALVKEGKTRCYGIGTHRHAARRILEGCPRFHGVVQIPNHLLQPDTDWFVQHAPRPLFTHSALRPLEDRGNAGSAVGCAIERWAALTGQDPDDPALPGRLFLLGALHRNPRGCVVFSSSTAARVIANAGLLAKLKRCGPALDELLASEGGSTVS
jgi:aryl-alcohol dehydrogenase-like predicted oxidoreductase